MNKAYLMSFVFAAALPAMAAEDQYKQFLEGVKAVDAAGVPTADGGDWTTNSVSLANNGGKVEFEASSSPLKLSNFTPGPADTNTIVRVELGVSVADVGTLMESSELTGAQTAFAVCTNAYHAWNGTDWVVLGNMIEEIGDDSQTTNLTVEIKYLGTNSFESGYVRAARFSIGGEVLPVRTNSSEWVALTTAADNFTGFGASGSGLLSKVDAEVMLGVAEYAGIKYGTLGEAVEVASADTLLDKSSVDVLRETDENVTVTNNVTIVDNGGNMSGTVTVPEGQIAKVQPSEETFTTNALAGASGEYTIPGVKVGGTGDLEIKLPASIAANKDVANVVNDGSTIKVTIQTAKHVLDGARPDGSKALSTAGDHETALRNYLDAHAHDAYVAADVSSESIQTALSAPRENGLPLYQSYALGIEPTDPVKPVAVANDTADDGITLAIPAVVAAAKADKQSGDYTIKYSVDGDEADVIKIPLNTGSHTVKIVFK